MKLRYLFILAPLCLGVASCGDSDNDVDAPDEVAGTPLKVMSYNIRYVNTIDLGETSWDSRRQPSIDMIKDQAPDLIGMQEARESQREDLLAQLGDTYEMFTAIDDGVADNRSGHTSILYNKNRFTVLDKGHFWLSPTPDTESRPAWGATDTAFRTTIWLLLHDNVADKDLYFFNTHLPYQSADKEARNECVKLNVARMKEKAGRHTPVFITGDMNASWHTQDGRRDCLAPYFEWMWSGREEANNLTPNVYSFNGFGESTPGVTWNIDHIFYRKATPVDFEVIHSEKYGVKYVSDHYPITLTLKY